MSTYFIKLLRGEQQSIFRHLQITLKMNHSPVE